MILRLEEKPATGNESNAGFGFTDGKALWVKGGAVSLML
jgi:hypothetical protein